MGSKTTIKQLQRDIREWMADGHMFIETSSDGFGKVLDNPDDAIKELDTIDGFVLYNPLPVKEGYEFWNALIASKIDGKWESECPVVDPNQKKPRKVIAEIRQHYDEILAGTYNGWKPSKKKAKTMVMLGDFLNEHQITQEMWDKMEVEIHYYLLISKKLYERLSRYRNYTSFFGEYGDNEFGHIYFGEELSDYPCGDFKVVKGKETGFPIVWFEDYSAFTNYGPDCIKWEDVCQLKFDKIEICDMDGDKQVHCFSTSVMENDHFLKYEVMPYFRTHSDD